MSACLHSCTGKEVPVEVRSMQTSPNGDAQMVRRGFSFRKRGGFFSLSFLSFFLPLVGKMLARCVYQTFGGHTPQDRLYPRSGSSPTFFCILLTSIQTTPCIKPPLLPFRFVRLPRDSSFRVYSPSSFFFRLQIIKPPWLRFLHGRGEGRGGGSADHTLDEEVLRRKGNSLRRARLLFSPEVSSSLSSPIQLSSTLCFLFIHAHPHMQSQL